MPIVIGIIMVVMAAASTAYSIHNANEAKDKARSQNAKAVERTKQQELVGKRQAAKSLMRAQQMAASGMVADMISTKGISAKAENEKVWLRTGAGTSDPIAARPERDYGSPIRI